MGSHSLVIIRTDGGPNFGLGHVNRCLALAHALRSFGVGTVFLLNGSAEVCQRVVAAGYDASIINPEADLTGVVSHCRTLRPRAVVVDSYAWTSTDLSTLSETETVVALDDVADREFAVSLVVNGSAGAERLCYRGSALTHYLLGSEYVLLRPEFVGSPDRQIQLKVSRVLITLGGEDPHELTNRVAKWVSETLEAVHLDIVAGPFFEREKWSGHDWVSGAASVALHKDVKNLHDLMQGSDLAVCGGGQTTYELAATGTPAIAVRLAENQTTNLKGLSDAGALVWVSDVGNPDLEARLKESLSAIASDPSRRAALAHRGRALIDGGGAPRVAQAILQLATR